jgi:hypothetical protein
VILQGGYLVAWRVHGSTLHSGRCAACREAHANFASETADNVWNEGTWLTYRPLHCIMFHSEQCGSCVGVCIQFASSVQELSALLAISSVTLSEQCCASWWGEQCVFLHVTHVKYGSAGKCRWKFRQKCCDERVPNRQTIHNLVNKLRTTGL